MSGVIGYTTGVRDMFHIGHLNILKQAKNRCDTLIVGVTSDELTYKLKGRHPIIPFAERSSIVQHIIYVDSIKENSTIDELKDHDELQFHCIFKGNDRKGTEKRIALEKDFAQRGVEVIFFPYTATTSSTYLRNLLTNDVPSQNGQ